MAKKVGSVYSEIRARLDKYEKDLAKAQGKTNKAADKIQKRYNRLNFDKAGKSLARFKGLFVTGIIAGGLGSFTSSIVSAASDLEEVTSKFNVVFEGMERQAESWAGTLVGAYAMSTRESKQYLSSVQDLLVPMGMQADAAARMSFETVKLAADLGSFNNVQTSRVILDIQSALVGNFETMKKYGVVLNARVVEQEAFALGLIKSKKELTASAKAQAAYNLIVKGSAAAIGDMERTSDSYANTLKRLKARFEELSARIGILFLPIISKVLSGIIAVDNAMDRFIIGSDAMDAKSGTSIQDIAIKKMEKQVAHLNLLKRQYSELGDEGKDALDNINGRLERLNRLLVQARKDRDTDKEKISDKAGQPTGQPQPGPGTDATKKISGAIGPGFWEMQAKERFEVQSRVLDDEIAAEKQAADAKAVIWEDKYGPGFWEIQAAERYEVQSRALEEMEAVEESASHKLIRLSERTAAAMQSNFSNLFYDGITGELKTFSDYFDSITNSMARVWSDLMGQMATEWIFGDIQKVGGGGGLFSSISKLFSGSAVANNGVMAGGAGSVNYGFGDGGHLGEGVVGIGRQSGKSYEFHANETVIPDRKLGGGGGMKIEFNLKNESGTPLQAEKQTIRQDPEKIVADIIIKRKMTNRGFRDALGS